MIKYKLLNYILTALFINAVFVCFSIIRVNAVENITNTDNQSNTFETGWTNKENQWYYYNNGEKATGWLHKGYWYYLDQDGKMVTGLATIGDQQCYFDESGAMQTGWILDHGTYYYANGSGYLQKVGYIRVIGII